MFSKEHSSKISQLRSNVKDLLSPDDEFATDFDYFRWLEVFDFDVKATTVQLRNRLKFDQVSPHKQPGFVRNATVEQVVYFLHPGVKCRTKEGCIFHYEWIGRLPLTNLRANPNFSFIDYYLDRQAYHDRLSREMRQVEAETGQQSAQYLVWDLKGMPVFGQGGMLDNTANAIRYFTEFIRTNNPGDLKKLILLNAPSAFRQAWRVVSTVFPDKVKKKIRFVSSIDEIHEDFDLENLPKMLGGRADVDLNNPEVAKVPPEDEGDTGGHPVEIDLQAMLKSHEVFYIKHGKSLLATITKSDSEPVEITWSFHSDGALDFGMFWYPEGNQVEQVDVDNDEWVIPHFAPLPVFDRYTTPETGKVTVRKPGIYLVRLHYRFGWFWSHAHVHCKFGLLGSEDSTQYEVK